MGAIVEDWKRKFNELRQDPERNYHAIHQCIYEERQRLLHDPANLNRYVVLPLEPIDLFCMSADCHYVIALPGKRSSGSRKNEICSRDLSFDRRHPVVLDEEQAHDLCRALNAGRLLA